MAATLALEATAITKTYSGIRALDGVSFELARGEIHALIGENGAGKSTFIKVLTGAVQPDSGTVAIEGIAIPRLTPQLSRSLGIAAIYQQPALFPDLSVAENIAIATGQRGLLRRIDWRSRRRHCQELLNRIGSSIHPDAPVSSLSMPEQQMVEIAKALSVNSKILILDEPTASLSVREVDALFRILKELRTQGVAAISISHRLEELPRIADRVTVFRDGRRIVTQPMSGTTTSELIEFMVGRELTEVFPKREFPLGDVVLELRGRVNLTLRAGEIVGLAGLVGAGRTELAEALFGLRASTQLEILLHGEAIQLDSPARAIAAGIGYVPEDRRRHGLIMEMPIAANATLASLRAISRYGLLDVTRERALASEVKEQLAVKAPSIDLTVDKLSGGNQQKVVIGRWLMTGPRILILDEPTQGVDAGAKSEIYRIMGDLAGRGLAILMISSELTEILGMSDRIAVMRGGRIEGTLDRSEATEQSILALALGAAA